MTKLTSVLAFCILILCALLLTGVINDTYIILFLGLLNGSADITAGNIQKLFDAFVKKDWASIGTISVQFMYYGLYVYFLRCVIYFLAAVTVVLWARPYLGKIFVALKSPEVLGGEELGALSPEDRRTYLIDALRARAGRKRVESYAFLLVAVLALTLSIGFVSREDFVQRPDALGYDATTLEATLDRASNEISAAQTTTDVRLSDMRLADEGLRDLVWQSAAGGKAKEKSAARGAPVDAVEYLKRPAYSSGIERLNPPAIANDIVGVARQQLEVMDNQAKLERFQTTAYVIAAKVAAVIIILALVRTLIQHYDRGHSDATQYDGIADAVQLGQKDVSENLEELRRALTPGRDSSMPTKVPKSILQGLIRELVSASTSAKTGGERGSDAGRT